MDAHFLAGKFLFLHEYILHMRNSDARLMGKKGSWFAAIIKILIGHPKDKPNNQREEASEAKNKNNGHGETRTVKRKSFIPLSRTPSSINKILGDAERECNTIFRFPGTSPPLEPPPKTPSFLSPPNHAPPSNPSTRSASPRELSPRYVSPNLSTYNRVISPKKVSDQREISCRHASATKIQAAYRGYMARRSSKALRGLVRLQEFVMGQNVRRQTMNAMKHVQLSLRVQSQIQSMRIQMSDNHTIQQGQHKEESNFVRVSLATGNRGEWDASIITKEEVQRRLRRKINAAIRRERAMGYAFCHWHQTRNQTTRPTQNPSVNLHPGGYPWVWNWYERYLPQINDLENQARTPDSQKLTSPMSNSDLRSNANGRHRNGFNIIDYSTTPTSIRSSISVTSSKHLLTPSSNMPVPPSTGPNRNSKHSRIKECLMESPIGMKDSDSLASCPSFSVPNYMVPTVSAKAKVRCKSNPKDRFPITSDVQSNRRKSIRSFKWNKRLFFPVDNDSSWKKECTAKHRKMDSGEDLSVNSVPILPSRANRMHLNRFA